jgi:hypothetical protein
MMGNPEGMIAPGRPRREWKMVLKWNLNKCDIKWLTALTCFRIGKNYGFL